MIHGKGAETGCRASARSVGWARACHQDGRARLGGDFLNMRRQGMVGDDGTDRLEAAETYKRAPAELAAVAQRHRRLGPLHIDQLYLGILRRIVVEAVLVDTGGANEDPIHPMAGELLARDAAAERA